MTEIFKLNDAEFKCIREITYTHTGVNLTEGKKPLIVSRMSKRLRQLGFKSFAEYCRYLKQNHDELETMTNLITTNVTKFFREMHHFEYLRNTVLPLIIKDAATGSRPHRIKAWSAGCSTGEEPYSIAIVLDDFLQQAKGWDFSLLASDVNSQVLKHAADGIYKRERVKGIPYELLTKYFAMGTGSNKGLFKIKEPLRNKIKFKNINLFREEEYPRLSDLDIIFCRNVFIYFDRESQNWILQRFANRLSEGGHLFLGHSETISIESPVSKSWKLVQHTVYQKL